MGELEEPIDRADSRGLAHGVGERITALIVNGDFRLGDRLPSESALMERYAVSRTAIREAISRLQAAGLVETYRGKGTFVLTRPVQTTFTADPAQVRTLDDVVQLIDFRLGCEVEAAGLAAGRRTPAQLTRISEAHHRFATSDFRPSGQVDADFQFHLSVAKASNNRYYVDVLKSLGPTMIAMPQTRLAAAVDTAEHDLHPTRVSYEHEDIFAAIERGDVQAAAAAARTHLANSRARLKMRSV